MTITITVRLEVDPEYYATRAKLRRLLESDEFRDEVEDAVNVACDDVTGIEPADSSVTVKVEDE